MKRKFVKVMFFGALALSTVTYVGCKDYDDDIDNLQTQIDANKASIAELQAFVKEGKWVESVDDIAGGFKITFNNGKSYSIVDGADGADGTNGTNGTNGKNGTVVTIGPNNTWLLDGVDTGLPAVGPKGENGKDGQDGQDGTNGEDGKDGTNGQDGIDGRDGLAPRISPETGCWEVYDFATSKWNDTGIVANATIYITEVIDNPLVWELHVREKKGDVYVDNTVTLPRASSIINMTALTLNDNVIVKEGCDIELFYGTNTTGKDVTDFHGNTYVKGAMMTASGLNSGMISVQINPADIELELYKISLVDSKGNDNYVITAKNQNMTKEALTRAAGDKTVNKGVFDLTVGFNTGKEDFDVADLKAKATYALSTRDPFGKEILSKYDVTIKATNQSSSLTNVNDAQGKINTSVDLNKLMGDQLNKIVDCQYSLDLQAGDLAKGDIDFSQANATILAKKEGTATLKVDYLKTNGEKAVVSLKITFKYHADPVILTPVMEWTVNDETVTADIPVTDELKAYFDDAAGYTFDASNAIIAFDKAVTVNGSPVVYDNTSIVLTAVDKNAVVAGATTTDWVIRATFAPTTVCATLHNVSVDIKNKNADPSLGNEIAKTIQFQINVKAFTGFSWEGKHLEGYFNGNAAKAFGTLDQNKVTYNLYGLYDGNKIITAKNYIKFDEVVPKGAQSWFENGDKTTGAIIVDKAPNKGGVGIARTIKAIYTPFNNPKLAEIVDEIQLTVISEFGAAKYSAGVKTIKNENGITIESSEFKIADIAKGKDVALTDSRVESRTWVGDDQAKAYLDMTPLNGPWDGSSKLTVKKNTTALVASAQTCKLTLVVTDKWGVSHSEAVVTVVVDKFQ